MIEYKIVENDNATQLETWVSLLLNEGWELRGNLILGEECYVQVLTRERLNPNRIIPN